MEGRAPQGSCSQCPTGVGAASLSAAAASCTFLRGSACVHEPTRAARSVVTGLSCMNATNVAARGFFVISLAASGSPVCSGGDQYHTWVETKQSIESVHFAALSQPASIAMPNVYWVNTSATAALPGERSYKLAVSLVETS